jgi:mutator protein MutT
MTEQRTTSRLAVFIIIRDEQDRVLLQRRAGTGFMDGFYDFPSGHVDAGESFTEAAVRELAEETGLTVAESDLTVQHINQNYLDSPYVNIVFVAQKWSGTPQLLEPAKCNDQQFFAVDALPEKCTLAVRYVERDGWTGGPHLSKITADGFRQLIGVSHQEITT